MEDITYASPLGQFVFRETGLTLRVEGEGERAGKFRVLRLIDIPPGVIKSYAAEMALHVVESPIVATVCGAPAVEGMNLVDACALRADALLDVRLVQEEPPWLGEPDSVELRAGDPGAESTIDASAPVFMSESLRRSGVRLHAREGVSLEGMHVVVTCGFIPNVRFMDVEFASCVADGLRWSGPVGAEGPIEDMNMVVRLLQDE